MDVFNEIYYKSLTENERNLSFWEGYLRNLESLDFNAYSEKLKVPILVPIGTRILFRGELKHTNEVTIALGADYFVKCSLKQADILKQHRIKVAQENVHKYNKEKEYLQKQMTFTNQNIYQNQGQEIIEYHTVEEDKIWREEHRANVKKYMQTKGKHEEKLKDDITDEELWNRLEELELQEELENELNDVNTNHTELDRVQECKNETVVVIKDDAKAIKEIQNMKVLQDTVIPEQSSKLHLLQQVIERQKLLDEKLHELKNREKSQSKTENDLMSRLDELEQLDELEDELDRLDDIIDNEDDEECEEDVLIKANIEKLQRRVSFIDESDSETLHLSFKHSDVEPNNKPYDPNTGIQKPSDIYTAHSNCFSCGTTSILKKSKYVPDGDTPEVLGNPIEKDEEIVQHEKRDHIANQTIVLKDVLEKTEQSNNTLETETKPMSLFKKKRMQNKL